MCRNNSNHIVSRLPVCWEHRAWSYRYAADSVFGRMAAVLLLGGVAPGSRKVLLFSISID